MFRIKNKNWKQKNFVFLLFIANVFCSSAQNKQIDSLTTLLNQKNLADSIRCKLIDNIMTIDDKGYYSWNNQLIATAERGLKKASTIKDRKLYMEWLADATYNKGCEYDKAKDTTNMFICFRKCLSLYKANGNIIEYADTEYTIGVMYEKREMYGNAVEHYLKAKTGHEIAKNDESLVNTLNSIGLNYSGIDDYENALKYYKESLIIAKRLKDPKSIARAYSNLGLVYENLGDIKTALEYKLFSLKIFESFDKTRDVGTVMNNIALFYSGQGDYENALKYYTKSYNWFMQLKDTSGLGLSHANIGAMYAGMADLIKLNKTHRDSLLNIALSHTLKALEFRRVVNYQGGIATSLHNLGRIYNSLGEENKALAYFKEAFAIREKLNDKHGIAGSLNCIADLMLKAKDKELQNIPLAKEYAEKSLKLAKEMGLPSDISSVALTLKAIYKKQGAFEKALEMHELYITMRDSINSENTRKAAKNQTFKYEWDKRESELKTAQDKKDVLANEEKKRQRFVSYGIIGILLIVLVFSVSLYRRFKITQKQKRIIELKEGETRRQKHLVEEKQKEITDSITYALRLQQAILPPQEYIRQYVPHNFVLYKPKDIVAGDFYWAEYINDLFFIAAADSTGHGVPGAMVSVVCSNALNRTVKEFNLTETGSILGKTRELVLDTFGKSANEVKDGMDISLLCIDMKNKKISWSGANNPLWYVVNGELKEIKANKQPIGKTDDPKPFTTHDIEYNQATVFYLFTDGFPDQFGGPNGKKFKYKQLEKLILENYQLSMSQQATLLESSFDNWKGDLEQVDDVCIIGIRV